MMSFEGLAIKHRKNIGENEFQTRDWPRNEAVANIRLLTGHCFLEKHLYHVG